MLDLALPLVQVMLQNFAQFMGKSTGTLKATTALGLY
jgi:hypothetical protein